MPVWSRDERILYGREKITGGSESSLCVTRASVCEKVEENSQFNVIVHALDLEGSMMYHAKDAIISTDLESQGQKSDSGDSLGEEDKVILLLDSVYASQPTAPFL